MLNTDAGSSNIRYNPRDDHSYRKDTTSSTRPTQDSKPGRDFKKVLARRDDEPKEEGVDEAKKKSTRQNVGTAKPSQGEEELLGEKAHEENISPFDLARSAKSKQEGANSPGFRGDGFGLKEASEIEAQNRTALPVKADKPDKTPPFQSDKLPSSKRGDEQSQEINLANVNPLSQTSQVQGVETAPQGKVEGTAPVSDTMQDLIAEIEAVVKTMYTVETKDKTDTVVILQQPPMFKDAQLTVSTYDTGAKGQFNIKFENLTPEAQRILDLESNRQTLFNALEEKGYGVHIFTTTQQQASPIDQSAFKGQEQGKREGDQGGGEQSGGQGKGGDKRQGRGRG